MISRRSKIRFTITLAASLGLLGFDGRTPGRHAPPASNHVESRAAGQGTQHPRDELRVRPDGARIGTIASPEVSLPDSTSGLQRLLGATKVATIGRNEGEQHEMFGRVSGVEIDQLGRVYVLDSRFSEVRVFDRLGRHLASQGRPGQGPGEYLEPRVLISGSNGSFMVADGTRALTVLTREDVEDGLSLDYVHRAPVDMRPFGGCQIGDRLLLLGLRYANEENFMDPANATLQIFHVFTTAGDYMRSFGRTYAAKSPLILFHLTDGPLVCDRLGERLYYAPATALGEVRAYNLDGDALWITPLPGYRPPNITERPNGASRMEIPADGFHSTLSIHLLDDNYILVQVALMERDQELGGATAQQIDTYVLDKDTGDGVFAGSDLPHVIAIGPQGFVTLREEPYGQLDIFSVQ